MAGQQIVVERYQSLSDEDYMSAEQLAHFRAVLIQWKADLMAEVDNTVTQLREDAGHCPDMADQATLEEEFSFTLRTRTREGKLLKRINDIIGRIDANNYGYCDTCGVEIGLPRLEARPTATECIDCKTLGEIKEKQVGQAAIYNMATG